MKGTNGTESPTPKMDRHTNGRGDVDSYPLSTRMHGGDCWSFPLIHLETKVSCSRRGPFSYVATLLHCHVSDTLGFRMASVVACAREIPCLMDDPQELASIPEDSWMGACSRSIWMARRGRPLLFPTGLLTHLGCIFLDFPVPFCITAYVRVFLGIVGPFRVWFVASLCGGDSSSWALCDFSHGRFRSDGGMGSNLLPRFRSPPRKEDLWVIHTIKTAATRHCDTTSSKTTTRAGASVEFGGRGHRTKHDRRICLDRQNPTWSGRSRTLRFRFRSTRSSAHNPTGQEDHA